MDDIEDRAYQTYVDTLRGARRKIGPRRRYGITPKSGDSPMQTNISRSRSNIGNSHWRLESQATANAREGAQIRQANAEWDALQARKLNSRDQGQAPADLVPMESARNEPQTGRVADMFEAARKKPGWAVRRRKNTSSVVQ